MLTVSQHIAQYLGPDPFSDLMSMQGEVYRKQPKRETLRIFIGQEPYFIKKHFGGSIAEYVKNIFTGKWPVVGASQEVKAIKLVTALGIPTTPLVGHGRRGYNPFTQQSFVLTRSLENTISLETYCEAWSVASPAYQTKKSIIAEVARISHILHEHHCYHRDYYLCHFLLQLGADKKVDPTKPVILHLIDLHRMHQSSAESSRWREKDLSALLFSALDAKITYRDVLRFMTIYTGLSVRTLLERRGEWQPVMDKARALYSKAQGDMPKQRWMQDAGEIMPHKAGKFLYPIELNEGSLKSQSALRVLPHHRWVIYGEFQGRAVVVKIFEQHADFLKECKGYDAALKAKIPCPARLLLTQTKMGREVIIYEYLDAKNPSILSADLIRLMAQMHQAGLSQKDCHLDNFLVDAQGKIVLCDLGSVVSRDLRPYGERASLYNLALLFAQCSPLSDHAHHSLFELYLKCRHWPLDEGIALRFWKEVGVHRQYRRRKWLEKTARTCTLFKCKWRLTHRVCMRRDFANLYSQTLIEHPQAYFTHHANFLKQGRGTTVVRTRLGETDVVIKRYNIKNGLVYIKRLLGGSKASRAWRMSHAIQTLGINTPLPLAMIEKRFIIFPQESYYVSSFVSGERLDSYLESHDHDTDEVAQALISLMEALRLGQCYHGDLKASNIMWRPGSLALLDCDAAQFISHQQAFEKAHDSDWKRLLANWPSTHPLRQALETYRE